MSVVQSGVSESFLFILYAVRLIVVWLFFLSSPLFYTRGRVLSVFRKHVGPAVEGFVLAHETPHN